MQHSFYIDVGILVRGRIKRELVTGARSYGVQLDVNEMKGLIDSRYLFTVSGDEDNVRKFMKSVQDFCLSNGALIE